MQPATEDEALDNFVIGVIFDISNEVKNNNQQINTIVEETNAKWSVLCNIKWDQHLLQNWLWCSSHCNSRKPNWNVANKTKNKSSLGIQHCRKNVPVLFIVTDKNSPPIIRLNSSQQLNLIKRILPISNSQKHNSLNEYMNYFDEIGTFRKIHHITIKQNKHLW